MSRKARLTHLGAIDNAQLARAHGGFDWERYAWDAGGCLLYAGGIVASTTGVGFSVAGPPGAEAGFGLGVGMAPFACAFGWTAFDDSYGS
ncbi:MAG TPA: hypothetical protein VKN99_03380 [Polyangia bacterium]|nr:hypothetical protein [Polyangia bacterium]